MKKYKVVVTTEYTIEAASKSIAQHLFFDRDSSCPSLGSWATQIAESAHFTLIEENKR